MILSHDDSARRRALSILGLAMVGVLLTLYLASYFFLMKLSSPAYPPLSATPMTVVNYYLQYGHEPYTQKWLMICLLVGAVPSFAGMGMLVRPVQRSLHGDARFATTREIARADLFGNEGIILGRWGGFGKFLMLPGQQGALCTAPPRSGKGAGLVQTNALSWMGSLALNDVRKECYRISAGWRSLFSEVWLFDPLSTTFRTAQFNPLSPFYISDDPAVRMSHVLKLANRLSPNGSTGDEFWPASCRDLFVGIALYVLETPAVPRTMGEVVRTVMFGSGDSIGDHLRKMIEARDVSPNPLSQSCKMMLYDFISLAAPTQSSIRKTFTSRLQLWTNPLIDAATSGDSFDLRQMRRKRMTIYFGVNPDDLNTLSVLTNLFFETLYGANMDVMPEDDDTLKYKLLAIEDEFTAKGKVAGFSQKVGLMGGYNILPFLICQSNSQLDSTYGMNDAQTIRECAGATVVYSPPPNAFKYAEDISRMLGKYTAEQVSRSRQAWAWKPSSTNESQTGRDLMSPHEVQLMGEDNEIVLVRGLRPIFCRKAWYWRQRVFSRRANLPVPIVKQLTITMPTVIPLTAKPEAKPADGAIPAPESKARPITAADIPTLKKRSLTDYAVNFEKIELPKGEPITDDDLRKTLDSFLKTIKESSQEV